jgi:MFS transporter, DHA1 family, solute carrier family 18 (vesicular amine transporter), member 1/2
MTARSSRRFALALVTFATFTDIVAYSIAVPVLPDLTRKLGASPTMVGLLFASFGVTALLTAIPMGVVSDRMGRKGPIVAGFVGLAAASVMLAFADGLPSLFVARLAQGAADAVTWVVGLALVADMYDPAERGRASGIVMSGASSAFVIGPSLGGWLYELGGLRTPFLAVAVMSAVGVVAAIWLKLPSSQTEREPVPILSVLRVPAVGACAAAVIIAATTMSMEEPVLVLHLQMLGINPGRIGIVFGIEAIAAAILHPLYGRLADRWGPRRLTLLGLAVSGCVMPALAGVVSFESAIPIFVVNIAALSLVIAPSLAYMAEATSDAGLGSFGVAYGLYNVAWGVGLLAGPAAGGFLFERMGLARLTFWWAPAVIVCTLLLARVGSKRVGTGDEGPGAIRN